MEKYFQNLAKYENGFEGFVLKKLSNPVYKFADLSDKYVWRKILKTRNAKEKAMTATILLEGASDAAMLYGLAANNETIFDAGVKGITLGILLLASLSKTYYERK